MIDFAQGHRPSWIRTQNPPFLHSFCPSIFCLKRECLHKWIELCMFHKFQAEPEQQLLFSRLTFRVINRPITSANWPRFNTWDSTWRTHHLIQPVSLQPQREMHFPSRAGLCVFGPSTCAVGSGANWEEHAEAEGADRRTNLLHPDQPVVAVNCHDLIFPTLYFFMLIFFKLIWPSKGGPRPHTFDPRAARTLADLGTVFHPVRAFRPSICQILNLPGSLSRI